MKIAHITIKNILGTRELDFVPSAGFTEIVGPNGSGKTTVLEAIKAVFRGGHDATLLRDGAEKGEIVLVLDDGTEIKKTVREHTSNVKISRDGRDLPRPVELIKQLVDRLSNNPVAFLTAPKDERVSIFLQSMPLTADVAKLEQISGVKVANAEGLHAYLVIEHVHDQVFKDRASTNRAVDEKEKTIKQLRQALPDAPDGIIGGEEELEAQLAEIDARKDHDLGEVHTKLSAFAQTISVQVASDEKTFDEQIEALQKQIESLRTHKADALAGYRLRVTNVEAKANVKRQEIKDAHRATREPVETQLAVLRTNRNAAAKREQTIETIRMLEGELGDLNQDVARQNKALEDIKQYKSDMLNNLPIPGVEVRNSEIYRHNIVFDRLNTAQRVDMAVELAKLRAGELGVVCVDGIEAMDSATFNEFRQRSQDSKLQFFVSHVTDGPFGIKTDDPF
jgi:energy-coupling factor transporter ATP-binding protein EcfA2